MLKTGIKNISKITTLFLLLLLCGCGEPKTVNGLYFDTLISVTCYDSTSMETLNSCLNMCADYELTFSKTNPNSELYAINARAADKNISSDPGVYCAVLSDDLFELMEEAFSIANETDEAFNPALGQVISLWDYKSESPAIPDAFVISEALSHTSCNSIVLDSNVHTIAISDPSLTLDLGGIAKGYVADKLKCYLISCGTTEAIIRLAGNIYCIGDKYNQMYTVALQEPFSESGNSFMSLRVSDTSVVTSGTYERYFEKNGKIYHHILDSKTGCPSTSDLVSVTIICDDSSLADALSTAVLVMGTKKGTEYIDSLDNVSAVLMDSNHNVYTLGSYFN